MMKESNFLLTVIDIIMFPTLDSFISLGLFISLFISRPDSFILNWKVVGGHVVMGTRRLLGARAMLSWELQ